jgi:hypothetical protein
VDQLRLRPVVEAVFHNTQAMQRLRAAAEKQILEFECAGDSSAAAPRRIAAWREGDTFVAVLDENGDMRSGAPQPDTEDDCWVVDYHGDGGVDRVVDYECPNGPKPPRYMVLYLVTGGFFSRGLSCVVIGDLDGRGHRWRLINYDYQQTTCQWLCRFDGNSFFSMGRYDEAAERWVSCFENPFCFYDPDGDGSPEIAIRLDGRDLHLITVRYSFDADHDAAPGGAYDYDFSITAEGPVDAPPEIEERFLLRDGKDLRYVAWQHARRFVETAAWSRAWMVWDETDNNVNEKVAAEREKERWEGVIAPGTEHFPQVGGPPISALNTRFEYNGACNGPFRLYASDVDHRIHLCGAQFGWIDVDYDHDVNVDMRFRFDDTDGNGFFDIWKVDADGDGRFEQAATVKDERPKEIDWDYDALVKRERKLLDLAQGTHAALMDVLAGHAHGWESPVEHYWKNDIATRFYAGRKILASPQGQRYYNDLIRESFFAHVRRGVPESVAADLDAAYLEGDAHRLVRLLAGSPASSIPTEMRLSNPLPVSRR